MASAPTRASWGWFPCMDGDPAAREKRMRLRYAGTCRVCGRDLPARTEALYERSTKTVRCLEHEQVPEPLRVEPEAVDRFGRPPDLLGALA
jgi:hypothetical protein